MTHETAYAPQNAWKTYTQQEENNQGKDIFALARRYLDFLSQCKTERETIAYVQKKLTEAGFSLDFSQNAAMRPLRGKAIFAARKGRLPLGQGIHLIAAHVDTPRLDLKQRPLIEQAQVAQAKTHYYGGIRKYQWLARPLALHGVLIREDGETVRLTLGENPHEPVFTIADLLPHLAQKQNTRTVAEAFEAEKLNLLMGHCPASPAGEEKCQEPIKSQILQLLADKYHICEEDFISAELQAVPAGPARFVGLDKGLIGGYGQDDRICVFTALEAFLNVQEPEHATAIIFWDKEEIGSEGATGAASRFFNYCMEDLSSAWEPQTRLSHVLLSSMALSADVQAALDPDYQDVHEKQNAALLGHGPCFSKFTGSRGKYGASEADAEYLGWLRSLFNAQNIPWQIAECGKVDQGGGGTVALFLAAYGLRVIDIGPAVLSMHSPFEISSTVDLYATTQAYTTFYKA